MILNIPRLHAKQQDFKSRLQQLLDWESVSTHAIEAQVKAIIDQVRQDGDAALISLTQQFDQLNVKRIEELQIDMELCQQALLNLEQEQRDALQFAAKRIEAYHQHQRMESWSYQETDGTLLGQHITPLDNVGIYVPGGKAAYPSSVLMNAIPARVAGVKQIVMVVPTPQGVVNPMVLAAAAVAGVDKLFTVGGAQAVAALAYGTETLPAVDKIVGPGNIYVAMAKRAVFGRVGIDMIAGPSEILVICDGQTDPDWIAMDLFSQAEHDEHAQSILISTDSGYFDKVLESMQRLLPTLERSEIIIQSLNNRGVFIQVESLSEAVEMSNHIAPEHLELSVADPHALLPYVRHAGAIFMGRHTPEAFGDYCAGPNHVLPTSGTARFSSPLGVYDFQKRSSVIQVSEMGADSIGQASSVLATAEGLGAHALSASYRVKNKV